MRTSLALVAGAATVVIGLSGCSDSRTGRADTQRAAPPAVPVAVATVAQKAVPVQVRAIGNVQAYSTVSIKAQINGQLMIVHFREGQDVRKGDLLFTIDPRPLQAALQQAEANLARDVAQVRQAEANLARDQAQLDMSRVQDTRYARLVKEGYVAREQYDQVHAGLDSMAATVRADQAMIENAQAAVHADQAAVESARLQLGYTVIRSPIDGRTGTLLVQPGNLVKANDVPILVTIAQVHPIYVAFSVPEQYLGEIRRYTAAGPLTVDARPPGAAPAIRGQVTFLDNAVDTSTGTIQLKGTFSNADGALWPGQFVDVVLTLTTESDAIVVPSQAIQSGQRGPYVFVVKPDLTVEERAVVPARTFGAETVVTKGLRPGERVVTDGQLRLVTGATVEVKPSLGGPGESPS